MTLPGAFDGDMNNLHYYQGIIIAEVVVMLGLYILLRFFHYVKWGYLQDQDVPIKQNQQVHASEEQQTTRKWSQKSWDVYFPIIYCNHLAALALTLCYIPYIFETVIAYIHLAGFLGLLIVNIFIKDLQPGKGNRTNVSRIFWAIMCATNMALIISGLVGVSMVL